MTFRRDAWHVSYGTLDGFSEDDTLAWFERFAQQHSSTFLHVWLAGQVIGQVEYRAPNVNQNGDISGAISGYINLFYLVPSYRAQGLGNALHEYVINDCLQKACTVLRLRVGENNHIAQRFYVKHGWQAHGEADDKGAQLMVKRL